MSHIDDDKNIWQPLQIRLFYLCFTTLHKIIFKEFPYFLKTFKGTTKGKLVTGHDHISSQRLFVLNLIFIGVVGTSIEENRCSESFYKTGGVTNEGFNS